MLTAEKPRRAEWVHASDELDAALGEKELGPLAPYELAHRRSREIRAGTTRRLVRELRTKLKGDQ
jgi:hypothetical protein